MSFALDRMVESNVAIGCNRLLSWGSVATAAQGIGLVLTLRRLRSDVVGVMAYLPVDSRKTPRKA